MIREKGAKRVMLKNNQEAKFQMVLQPIARLALSAADPISRVLGRTGINVATRLMGLMLAALGVELIVDGLTALIPALRH